MTTVKTPRKKTGWFKRDWRLYLMLLIPVVWYLLFCYKPMAGVMIAFQKYSLVKGMWGSKFVGWKNFAFVMKQRDFLPALINTLKLNIMGLIVGFPVPVILAIMLNEIQSRGVKRVSQTLLYLPHFLSWVVIAGIWKSFLAPGEDSAINMIIGFFGQDAVDLLTDKGAIRWVLFFCEAWRSLGWDSIVFYTAIIGISADIYEAAALDGASRKDIILHIILPELLIPMTTVFILNLGFFMSAGFDQVYNFTNASVNSVIDILDTYVNRIGIENGQYSLGTAVSLIKGVVGLILVYGTHITSKKLTGEGVW